MLGNNEWKGKLWAFSNACTKWGADKDHTDRMNDKIMKAHCVDTVLYDFCKYSAELQCLKYLQDIRQRHPRDDELRKCWHQFIPQGVNMKHPQKGYEL